MRILYIDIDTLRPDHLPIYGYPRPTAPTISAIAREGVWFTACYTSDSPCVPARAALVSGRMGIHNGVVTHWGPGANFRWPLTETTWDQDYSQDAPLFPRYLRQHGYRTATVSSFGDKHQAPWFGFAWSESHNFTLKRGNEGAEEVAREARAWLAQHGREENWLLHVHFWDPHKNYTMPPHYVTQMARYPAPPWPDARTLDRHQDPAIGPGSAADFWAWGDRRVSPVPTMPDAITTVDDFRQLIDSYDGAIRYADEAVAQILGDLRGLGIEDETAIIIASDHGEAFGEHGLYAQHADAGRAVERVPLIVRWPGAAREVASDALVYLQDIVPTIVDLLGLPMPPGWDFQSVASIIRSGNSSAAGRRQLVWGHGLYVCQRALFDPPWLYLRTYHPGLFDWPEESLYAIDRDPHETENRVAEEPAVASRMRGDLARWLEEASQGNERDPMDEVIASGGPYRYVKPGPWLNHLRAMGWEAAARRVEQRLRSGTP